MSKKNIIWYLFPAYIMLVTALILLFIFFSNNAVRSSNEDALFQRLTDAAKFLELQLNQIRNNSNDLQGSLRSLIDTNPSDLRITMIASDGRVLIDSLEKAENMENHGNRDEVIEALANGTGNAIRFSETLKRWMFYHAREIEFGDGSLAILRVSHFQSELTEHLKGINSWLLIFFILSMLSIIGLFIYYLNNVHLGLKTLIAAAGQYKEGNFTHSFSVNSPSELANLSQSIKTMGSVLEERLGVISGQKNELLSIIETMGEPVLVIDQKSYTVSRLNSAAAQLADQKRSICKGKTLLELFKSNALSEIVKKAGVEQKQLNEKIEIDLANTQSVMQVSVSPLIRQIPGSDPKLVVVMNDLTQLIRLERVRKDFVSNVSHELRTPLTSIKGFVDTLINGVDEQTSHRFLSIVSKQVTRMESIIEDLLTLSRLDQQNGGSLELKSENIHPLIEAAFSICAHRADGKQIGLINRIDPKLQSKVNAALFEQVLINLIENGIKYSDNGKSIELSAELQNEKLIIKVKDEGYGIPQKELPRIFERFYRVDKGRNRETGGTGLGLAIVKHIMLLHGGYVDVKSRLGEGTEVSLILEQK
jgi:two-component system phosphate regulon sensor histidine kinase PhoR